MGDGEKGEKKKKEQKETGSRLPTLPCTIRLLPMTRRDNMVSLLFYSPKPTVYIYIYMCGGGWLVGGGGPRSCHSCFMWLCLECAHGLAWQYRLPGLFSTSGGLSVSALVTASCFLVGNKEAKLKPTTSLHFYFSMFSCPSSSFNRAIAPWVLAPCWGYSLLIIII